MQSPILINSNKESSIIHQQHQAPQVLQSSTNSSNARNLPNKISSSLSNINGVNSSHGAQVISDSGHVIGGGGSQRPHVYGIGKMPTSTESGSYSYMGAYSDVYQPQLQQNKQQIPSTSHNFKMSQNLSRSNITSATKSNQSINSKVQQAVQNSSTINTLGKHVVLVGGKSNNGGSGANFQHSMDSIATSENNNNVQTIYSKEQRKTTSKLHHLHHISGQDSERHHIQRESMIQQSSNGNSGSNHHHQEKRRNVDYKISKTSERIVKKKQSPTSQNVPADMPLAHVKNLPLNRGVTLNIINDEQSKQVSSMHDLRHLQQKSQQEILTAEVDNEPRNLQNQSRDIDQMSMSTRVGEDTLQGFLDSSQNLNGRIGVYKINFNKNLKRFQDIASEQAIKEPKLAEVASLLLQETLLPSIWSFAYLGQSSKFLRQVQSNSIKHSEGQTSPTIASPDREQNSEIIQPTYELNSATLPLQINFNPLMITFSLFLRALADLANSNHQVSSNEKKLDGKTVAEYCLIQRKKIISKLYQIQIKAVNHALQSVNVDGVPSDGLPAKVIEFIKKWVSKEKVLISHCVKQLVSPEVQAAAAKEESSKLDDANIYVTKDLAARKNREQYASRVHNKDSRQNRGRGGAGVENLNSSKESEDFADGAYIARAAIEIGGMTQDNFYKAAPPSDASPWKPGDHSMSHPNNLMVVDKVQPSMSLQQKVNSRHREAQHRNLFVEYHQMGNLQKQNIFKEPQMALSSTNFNKNHSNSLMQIKIQQQQNQQQPSGLMNQKTQGRQGIVSDVYGDWKQSQTSNLHRVSGVGKIGTTGDLNQSSQKEFNGQDFSHRASMNRSFSPTQFQPDAANPHDRFMHQQITDFDEDHSQAQFPAAASQSTLMPIPENQNKIGIQGALTVTSGFFNPHKLNNDSSHNLRNVQNKSDLGYQNLQNFQWPRNTTSNVDRPGSRSSAFRPQTRDSYFENGGRQKQDSQSLAMLTGNSGMMRSTGGPATFNLGRGQKASIRQGQFPTNVQAQLIERPSTRHGSDERSPNLARPITQGISRRGAGLAQINPAMNAHGQSKHAVQQSQYQDTTNQKGNRQRSVKKEQQIDKTYINNQGVGRKDVINRRTSSRGMNRIYGGGSATVNKVDPSRSKGMQGEELQSIKSLPPGFDPIFNNSSTFVNENSHIKIKPMRLSKGFDSGDIHHGNEVFENTETSSVSAMSRGNSIGTLENQDHSSRADDKKMMRQQMPKQVSPIYGKEKSNDKIERKRNSKGKVISGHTQSGHFRKKITSKNNRETAMESILEEDENQGQHPDAKGQDVQERLSKKTSIQRKKDGSNGSTTMSSNNFQLTKNENVELSTMQTSGGFSNTRRSPRDPSFEKDGHQLRLRPQLISQNYNSLHQLRPIDKHNEGNSLRPIPGANQTSYEFNNIIEEEEFAYQDEINQFGGQHHHHQQQKHQKNDFNHKSASNGDHHPMRSKNNKRKLLQAQQQQNQNGGVVRGAGWGGLGVEHQQQQFSKVKQPVSPAQRAPQYNV